MFVNERDPERDTCLGKAKREMRTGRKESECSTVLFDLK